MLVLPDPLQASASRAFEEWRISDVELVAPPLFPAEVTSVLRSYVFDGRLLPERGDHAFEEFLTWPIAVLNPPGLPLTAWTLAKTLNLRRAYDMQYVALASLLDCELWTADRRLWNVTQSVFPKVHWIGELVSQSL